LPGTALRFNLTVDMSPHLMYNGYIADE